MPKRLCVFALIVLALVSSAFGQLQTGAAWPKFQSDASSSGLGVAHGFNSILRWQFTRGDQFAGTPVIDANGILYAANTIGNVYAFNTVGTVLWICPTGDDIDGSAAIGSDGTVYVAGSNGGVYAISGGATGGSILWSHVVSDGFEGGVAIGPDGTLYVGSLSGKFYAFKSGPSGGYLWTGSGPGGAIYGTPAVGSDNTVYVATANGNVAAYAGGPAGGKQLFNWSTTDNFTECPSLSPDSSIISGASLYVAGTSGTVYRINGTSSGASLGWSIKVSTGDQFLGCPSLDAFGNVYVAGSKGNIYAFTIGGSTSWGVNEPSETFGGSIAIDSFDTIYVEGESGHVYALNGGASGGRSQWTNLAPQKEDFVGSPAIGADGTVYVEGIFGTIEGYGAVQEVTSLEVNSLTVIGGISLEGTVTTLFAATGDGWTVDLGSNSPYVMPPGFVTVQPGQTTATFQINTTQPPSPTTCTITATDPMASRSVTVSVLGDYITGLSVSPSPIGGGDISTGTVTLYEPAPPAGYVVNLSTEYPASVGVPTTVTVQGGQSQATFPITTKQFSNTFNCDIYATDGFSGAQATLNVVGNSIASLSLNPSSIGCGQTSTGTITLSSAAPSAGWVVNLSSEYPGSVSVPATVTIPANATSATFTITSLRLSTNTFGCDIYASDGHSATQQTLTVSGDSLASVSFATSVVGGNTATGTVMLTAMAPPGGWVVHLFDSISIHRRSAINRYGSSRVDFGHVRGHDEGYRGELRVRRLCVGRGVGEAGDVDDNAHVAGSPLTNIFGSVF